MQYNYHYSYYYNSKIYILLNIFFSSLLEKGKKNIRANEEIYFCPRILQIHRLGYGSVVTLISAKFIFARAPNVTEACRYRRNKTEIYTPRGLYCLTWQKHRENKVSFFPSI